MIRLANQLLLPCLALLATLVCSDRTFAQNDAADDSGSAVNIDETHDALRVLRDGLLDAIAKKDVEAILGYLHEDVVLTAQDGDKLNCVRKHDGVRDYMDRLLTGESPGVKSLELDFHVYELTVLYGDDSGVAFGHSNDHYVLSDGNEFDLATRWTSTVVFDGNEWKVASIHVSSNLFDNPVLGAATGYLMPIGAGALVAGLLIGFVIARVVGSKK
ncbi:MAG: nuclear transport factor 2 family protein [Planctomycetota bacterium]